MSEEAAEIYDRARQSDASSEETWARIQTLAATHEWDTSWLENDEPRRFEPVLDE